MQQWRRSRGAAAIAATTLAIGLAISGGAASAAPSEPGDASAHGKSELKHTGTDYNKGRPLAISKGQSEKIAGQPPLGPSKVGSVKTWLALDDAQGSIYLKNYTLRGVGDNIEIWVANDRAFPEGDCRNDLGTTEVTDAQVANFIDEWDDNILPKESGAFSVAPDRNGKHATLPSLIPNLPSSEYKGEGDNVVVLVDNVRDQNFYNPTAVDGRTYIAGFFYSVFNEYFDRNVMSIDVFDWQHRTGANPPDDSADPGYVACSEEILRPFGDPRPHLYEGTFAHEYQHLLEYYEDPDEASWINEGLSDWAQTLVGYVDPTLSPDDPDADGHIAAFLGFLEQNFGGPENSLTAWQDQGAAEILADYGAAYSFVEYLESHYGPSFLTGLHREDGNGLVGLDTVLDQSGATASARDSLHDWAATVAVDQKVDAGGVVNGGTASVLSAESLGAKVNWDSPQAYDVAGAPPNGSDYVRLRGGDGTYLSAADISSITFSGDTTLEPDPVEWEAVTDAPDATTPGLSCGNPVTGSMTALYSGCGPNLDRAIVAPASVPAGGGTLSFDALWDTEVGWDYGYAQVSSDAGATWTSLPLTDATSEHDPGAIAAVVANLPGLTGDSGGWTTQSADLGAYAGQDVLLAFRYITDSGVDEGGFWVKNISVAGTTLPSDTLEGWRSISEIAPYAVQGFTVQLVGYGADGDAVWYHRLVDGGFTGSLDGAAVAAAIGTEATTVAAIVMYDDDTELAPKAAGYALTVNGVLQPGG